MPKRKVGREAPHADEGGQLTDDELEVWSRIFTGRHVVIVLLGLLPLVDHYLPARINDVQVGVAVSALVLGLLLPIDLYDAHLMRTRRSIPAWAPFIDELAIVAAVAIEPGLIEVGLLLIIAVTAIWTAAFSRLVSFAAATAGVALVTAVLAWRGGSVVGARLFFFTLTVIVMVWVVGALIDLERRVRDDRSEIVTGVGAVLWRQPDPQAGSIRVENPSSVELGLPFKDWEEGGFAARLDGDGAARLDRALQLADESGSAQLELTFTDPGDRDRVLLCRLRSMHDESNRVVERRGMLIDVTDSRRTEERVARLVEVLDHLPTAVLAVEGDELAIIATNNAAANLSRHGIDQMMGRPLDDVADIGAVAAVREALRAAIETNDSSTIEECPIGEADDRRTYRIHTFALPGRAAGLVFEDVSIRAQATDALRRLALEDPLTGLASRNRLLERIPLALDAAELGGASLALILLDLDNFRALNDAVGHEVGDRLLVAAAERLTEAAPEGGLLCRVGGDGFGLLVEELDDPSTVASIADDLVGAMASPFRTATMSLPMRTTAGVALAPDHAKEAGQLLQHAETALHQAKRDHLLYRVFDPLDDPSSVEQITLVAELGEAIEADDLVLHFQPIIDLRTGEVVRAEALVRWQHSSRGLLGPHRFIGLAEATGLIEPLTRWVVLNAVLHAREWAELGLDVAVAINLSVRDLHRQDLAPTIANLLRTYDVPSSRLWVEVTETQLIDDPEAVVSTLEALRSIGVRAAIDDFGTGYASLSYLQRLPVDEVKIDRYFVMNIETSAPIIEGTIQMSHRLGLEVVAEGVETEAELTGLIELGCHLVQGYHFARPMPADDFIHWCHEHAAGGGTTPPPAQR